MRYFEDFRPGDVLALPGTSVSAEEIIAFARAYDPQPFHTDPEAAKESAFGGLVASGWHTCALMMRMLVEALTAEGAASLGSPGIESCRWLRPVRPGDRLSGSLEVLETWPSRSKPMGFVKTRTELVNQDGEVVLALTGLGMYRCRPAPAAEARA